MLKGGVVEAVIYNGEGELEGEDGHVFEVGGVACNGDLIAFAKNDGRIKKLRLKIFDEGECFALPSCCYIEGK